MKYFTSFIIPVFNAETVLAECIKHLKKQKGKKEIIVVDDGSTDRTLEIAQKAGVNVVRKKHSGVPDTFNLGIKHAKGNLIALIDSDCYLDDDWLEKSIKRTEDGFDVVMGRVKYMKPKEHKQTFVRKLGKILMSQIPFFNIDLPTFGEACLIRKEVFDKIGLFSKKFEPIGGHDIDIALRAVKTGFKLDRYNRAQYSHDMRRLKLNFKTNFRKFIFYKYGEIEAYLMHLDEPVALKLLINNTVWVSLFPFLLLLRFLMIRLI